MSTSDLGYLPYEDLTAELNALVSLSEGNLDLITVGTSRSGRKIVGVRTVPSGSAGKAPAVLVTANLHPSEVFGSAVGLKLIQAVASRPSLIPSSVSLIVLPRICVDSTDRFLAGTDLPRGNSLQPEIHRWQNREISDVDDNGAVLDIRVPDPSGQWTSATKDGFFMVPREQRSGRLDAKYYRLLPESKRSEEIEETEVVDLNRNFPAGWSTNIPWGGDSPLCEVESQALADFVEAHPEIALAIDLHTFAGSLVTPKELDSHPLVDKAIHASRQHLGFPAAQWASDAESDYPSQGTFARWLWAEHDIIPLVVELYGPHYRSGALSPNKLWKFDATLSRNGWTKLGEWLREIAPEAIYEWKPCRKLENEFTEAEIGGIDRRFSLMNPPPDSTVFREERARSTDFLLALLDHMPQPALEVSRHTAQGSADRIAVAVRNTGGVALGELWPRSTNPVLCVKTDAGSKSFPIDSKGDIASPNWLNICGTPFHPYTRTAWSAALKIPQGTSVSFLLRSKRGGVMAQTSLKNGVH